MRTPRTRRTAVLLSVLLAASAWAFVEELDDTFMETRGDDDVWLIKFYAPWCSFCKQLDQLWHQIGSELQSQGSPFYAPWCSFCKQLDQLWHQIGSELQSQGSPVSVGKADAMASTGLAKEFQVRGYPAVVMLKKGVKYNYSGPRTKDGILEFAHRVAGPVVRSLVSLQLFQHNMKRHNVMFVYVGATSALKGNYTSAAETMIVHTNFFSSTRDVLPKVVSLPSLPVVVVFKDGTYFTFDEKLDGDLKSWINRERFPNYLKIDSYTLYAMGESDKLVALALVEDKRLCEDSRRHKSLMEKVSADYRDIYSRDFYFGFMEGTDYISGLVMGEVVVPSFIVVNLSTDGYVFPLTAVETERQLLDFLNGVLEGNIQFQGGNGVAQRVRRFVYDIKATLTPILDTAPLLGYFLVSLPFAIMAVLFYLCRKTLVHRRGQRQR